MEKEIFCPRHKAPMIKKKILYGEVASNIDYSDVILGGCCINDDIQKYGFVCPSGNEIYYMDLYGKLMLQEEDN